MLRRIFARVFGTRAQATMVSESARSQALDTLRAHDIDAHYYLPAAGCSDKELGAALRFLGDRGYIMTDARGSIVGKVAKATLSADERAAEARTRFFLVEQ